MGNTSEQEILALISLIYLRGVLSLNMHNTDVLFNDKSGHPGFGATTSKNRFRFLMQNIRFDDAETRPHRWNSDRFVLSTMQPLMGVTKEDDKKKPAIYKLYDFTKGGTDIIDQRIGFYTCRVISPQGGR